MVIDIKINQNLREKIIQDYIFYLNCHCKINHIKYLGTINKYLVNFKNSFSDYIIIKN